MTARAAVGSFPYAHRTVAEVWSIPARKPRTIERPVLIDLKNVPSEMELRFAGKRA